MRGGRSGLRPSPLEWLCLLAGVVLLLRYAWLMDDAYVYFRYVDNLVFLDHGLVYNHGEYVEGFSSSLWAMLLSALRLTTLPYWLLVRAVGIASFLACGWLLIRLNRELSPAGAPVVNVPLLFVSLAYGPLCYFTSGLETPLVQVAAPVFALFLVSPGSLALELALSLSPLLRHELALPLGLLALFAWYRDGRFPWRLFTLSALFVGGWLLFRVWYYADLLPNTFYLKNLVDVGQGLLYLRNTVETYDLHVWLILHAALVVFLVRRRAGSLRLAERALMLGLALGVTTYVVKIGGDPRHYRYLAFPFVLSLCALSGLVEHALALLPERRLRLTGAAGAGIAVGVFALATYPEQLLEHPLRGRDQARMVNGIKDAAEHRRSPQLTPPSASLGMEIEQLAAYRKGAAAGRPPERAFAQSGCVNLYRAWRRYALHTLGLTDAILARTEMPADRPAHKLGLIPLAWEMRDLFEASGRLPDRGFYRAAVEQGLAPAWIAEDLETIEVIERKIYNRHDLRENLTLAFAFPDRIRPASPPPPGPDPGAF